MLRDYHICIFEKIKLVFPSFSWVFSNLCYNQAQPSPITCSDVWAKVEKTVSYGPSYMYKGMDVNFLNIPLNFSSKGKKRKVLVL